MPLNVSPPVSVAIFVDSSQTPETSGPANAAFDHPAAQSLVWLLAALLRAVPRRVCWPHW